MLDHEVSQSLAEEHRIYGDLALLPELVDAYERLTEKLATGIQWAEDTLQYEYLMKVGLLMWRYWIVIIIKAWWLLSYCPCHDNG